MIGRIVAASAASLALIAGAAGCTTFYEIPVEIPMQAKLDVSGFQRVLVAGFLAGGTRAIDPNTETARLLRSQLRSKSELKVIDADVLSLVEEVDRRRQEAGQPPLAAPPEDPNAARVLSAEQLAAYEAIFKDAAFWKALGDEYQAPLIVTGSMLFTEVTRTGVVSKLESYVDPETKETKYREVKTDSELKGYAMETKFIFVDGRTGRELHTETVQEETVYPAAQNTPALSSYFEIMDKMLPTFLTTLSTQKIRGARILIK
jgi:hypothetical protein